MSTVSLGSAEESTATDAAETTTIDDSTACDIAESISTLDTDTVFALLKNRRRRDVLRFLRANAGTVTMSDVAEYVAARENGIPESHLSSKQRKRVYVALYQCHLPMMDRAGVIDFNRARGNIDLAPAADQLQAYLDDATSTSTGWTNYLAVTIFGGLLFLFSTLLVGPGSWFSTLTVLGLIGAIIALSLAQGRDTLRDLAASVLPGNRAPDSTLGVEPSIAEPADD